MRIIWSRVPGWIASEARILLAKARIAAPGLLTALYKRRPRMTWKKIVTWVGGTTIAAVVVLVVYNAATRPATHKSSETATAQHSPTTAECPGKKKVMKLGSDEWTEVNKDGNCWFVFGIENPQNVLFQDIGGKTYQPGTGWQGRLPLRAKAISGTETIFGSLCPFKENARPLNFNCTPLQKTAGR